ncbi:MAG: 30S ribosomal protein S6 [Thermomicrobiales bacterium]|nr:30S ribosomal protein S6 [Thermomicrobiales bacterium]
MREQERAPRKYELMTILHPEVADESLPAELDRIQSYITTIGGELIESLRDSPWGRRRLAYPIRSGGKDVRDGYYTVWHFNLAPHLITEVERELKLNTQVIRYLVVTWEPKPLTPKEIEAAEIAAEDAAAAAYAAAQAEAAAATQQAGGAAAAAGAEVQAEPAGAAQPAEAPQGEGAGAAMGIAARPSEAEALTREAEAVEASGADVALETLDTAGAGDAIEPVSAIEARSELEGAAAIAVARAQAEASGETAQAAGTAGTTETTAEVPEGAIAGTGTNECPPDYPVKGNASSRLYHSPGSPSYNRTIPEFCFASVEAAEAAGFSPTKYEAAQAEGE